MRGRPFRGAPLAALCALALASLGVPAPAAAAQTGERAVSGPGITLADAVAATLRNSYNLQQAEQTLLRRRGTAQETSGQFDNVAFLQASFDFRQQPILRATRNSEIQRRVPLELLAIAGFDTPKGSLDIAADAIADNISTPNSLLFDDCRLGQTRALIDLADGSTITLCLNSDGNLEGVVVGGGGGIADILPGIDPGALPGNFVDGVGLRAEEIDDILFLLQVLRVADQQAFQDLADDIEERFADLMRRLAATLRAIADLMRIQRARLGPLPQEEQSLNLKLDVGLRRQLRNGLLFTSSVAIVGTELNYAGKPLDAGFGGEPSPNTFMTSAGLRLLAPLGRGRGKAATAGPERAAQAALRAEEHLYAHAASREALSTVGSYWRLAAAQERLGPLEASAAMQRKLLESINALIDAEELPGAERYRAEARYEEVLGRLAAARQAVTTSRLDLVRTMGQAASRLDTTPIAADPLPDEGGLGGDAESWAERARANRRDLAAAAETTRASDILARAAKANLRRQFDFTLDVSYSGYHESLDQRLYDPSGYWDAVKGRGLPDKPGKFPPLPQIGMTGPSYTAGLRVTFPFKNSEAKGRLVQAQSTKTRSQITERDLERKIRLQLHERIASLEERRRELAELRQTMGHLEQSLDASVELFEAGDVTLIDTLTTEQQLTDVRLAMVDVRLDIANLESQILFEAGELLVAPAEEPEEFDPATLELAGAFAQTASRVGP